MGEVKTLIISILIFSGLLTGISIFVGDLFNNYNQAPEDLSSLSRMQAMADFQKNISVGIGKSPEGGSNNIFFEAATGIFGVLTTILTLPWMISDLVGNIITMLSVGIIPGWFGTLIFVIISIIVVLKIISLVMKGDI